MASPPEGGRMPSFVMPQRPAVRPRQRHLATEGLPPTGRKARISHCVALLAIPGTHLPDYLIGYFLEEIVPQYLAYPEQQVDADALALEYVVHIRALTRYLRGEPTGIVALLLEHLLYPIANMHHTSTVYFNHINLEYKYSKPQGFDHPRGLPKREYA